MSDRIPRLRSAGILALALVALAVTGSRGDEGRWVGTCAASPQLTEAANMPPEPGLADTTLRQVVHVSLGGKRLRVRFSNSPERKQRDGARPAEGSPHPALVLPVRCRC